MNELKDGLQRARTHYSPPPDAFERFTRRRERKQLARRVGVAVVALTLAAAAVGVMVVAYRGDTNRSQPASQNVVTPVVNGKITFAHMVDHTWHLYIVNPDGSDQQEISTGSYASWSPDGTKLVVDRGEQGVFVMNADGLGAVKIADAGERPTPTSRYTLQTGPAIPPASPAWSPDGTKILIVRWANDPAVAYSKAQERALGNTLLTIVSGSSHLFVMNADGTGMTQLTSGAVADFAGSWSPDGTQIVFTRNARDESGIFVMNTDGSNVHELLATGPGDVQTPPSWSPDGSRILFTEWTGDNLADSRNGVYVMDADGSNVTRLSPEGAYDDAPEWSPDGTKIVFACSGICTMNADGSDRARITRRPTNPFDDFEDPSWGISPSAPPSA